MRVRPLLALPPAIFAAMVGCADDLPLRDRVVSTRPLAVRIEAIDPTADPDAPVRVETLPTERVRLVPWIVDEQGPLGAEAVGRDVEPVWLACPLRPVEGLFACLSARVPLSPADVLDCPELSPGDLGDFEELPVWPTPCRITGGTPARPELVVPLDPNFLIGGDLEVTMIGHVPGAGSTQTCLERLLEGSEDLPHDCIYVAQRVPVGPDGLLLQLAVDLGLISTDQVGPIPDTIPEPDANPRIQRFTVIAIDEADAELDRFEVARGEVLQLPAGTRLEVETEAPASDLQTYLVARDGESFAERQEAYLGLWFRTWGDLLSGQSNDPLSFNTWTLRPGPQDTTPMPPADRATLYYVLRDDRQGVDWWWFHVDVSEE